MDSDDFFDETDISDIIDEINNDFDAHHYINEQEHLTDLQDDSHSLMSASNENATDHSESHHISEPRFGGYTGTYNGVQDCWYSSDGFVYDSVGNRIGTH